MSETKFTPGPWSVRKHGYPIITDDAKNRWIATIHSVGPENEVREANAHLIAATPDMYEELECAKDVFRFYQSHHEFKGGTEKAIRNKEIADRIDRLLAKARGEV